MFGFHRPVRKVVLILSASMLTLASLFAGGLAFGITPASAGNPNGPYYACLKNGRLTQVGAIPPSCVAAAVQITLGSNGTNVLTTPATPYGSCNSGDTDIALSSDEVWSCLVGNWTDTGANIKGGAGSTGPQGPAGATGVQGATGPTGPTTAGTGGLDVITQSFTSTGATAIVFCPSDHPYATGGGGSASAGGTVISSVPITNSGEPTAWEATASTAGVTVYAICSV
jgi:hypothetical protein